MPILAIQTNVSGSKISADLTITFSKEFAKLTGKPVDYVACSISSDNNMSFGGSNEPCAIATLTSIGQINAEKNVKYSKKMSELLNEHLGIANDRYYMIFNDAKGSNIGYQGATF